MRSVLHGEGEVRRRGCGAATVSSGGMYNSTTKRISLPLDAHDVAQIRKVSHLSEPKRYEW